MGQTLFKAKRYVQQKSWFSGHAARADICAVQFLQATAVPAGTAESVY